MAVATGKVGRGNLLAGFQHGDAHAGFGQLLGREAPRGPRADYDGVENVTVTVDDLQHSSYSTSNEWQVGCASRAPGCGPEHKISCPLAAKGGPSPSRSDFCPLRRGSLTSVGTVNHTDRLRSFSSISRSKPSAFQAVSIKRVWMTIGGWASIGEERMRSTTSSIT